MITKALSPPRISQIFQSAEIPLRKLSEILTEFLGAPPKYSKKNLDNFHFEISAKRRYKKFSVEHTLFVKMYLNTRKVKQRLVFLTKISKTTAAKQTVRPAK